MKAGLLKALILGLGITFLSSGMAFASTEEAIPAKGEAQGYAVATDAATVAAPDSAQVDPIDPNIYTISGSGDTSVSNEVKIDEALLKKQSEIDMYLFEQHKDDMAAKDIFVTHTAPINGLIEIGITPYTDASAEYLYSIFGKDTIVVVEGRNAQIYETGPVSEPAPDAVVTDAKVISAPVTDEALAADSVITATANDEIRTLSATGAESAQVKSDNTLRMTIVYSLGALIVLGTAAMLIRSRAAAAKR